ncbi:MAG TPA: polysaccharide deacetylase family protein [Gemmatimonadales bacterium]|nr:polysaccharide deacetylase family protein [Gemmatimonadales bacterium]
MIAAALAAATAGAAGLLTFGALEPNNGLFGPVTGRGPRCRSVYLTFDDGPNQEATPAILDALHATAVPATFFLVGRHVTLFPALARRVAAEHTIGNHTQSHVKLHRLGPRRVQQEVRDAHEAIVSTTGATPRMFRAPHGYRNPFLFRAVRPFRYQVMGWTFGVWDTARPGSEEIRRRMRAKLRPGAILLLHDGDGYDPHGDRRQTAEALPGIIDDVRAGGYEFRPLTELLTP